LNLKFLFSRVIKKRYPRPPQSLISAGQTRDINLSNRAKILKLGGCVLQNRRFEKTRKLPFFRLKKAKKPIIEKEPFFAWESAKSPLIGNLPFWDENRQT
jgi:hypothetical protein